MIKNFKFFNFIAYCDAPTRWQMGPQDPATPVMEGMISFHNYLMFFMILIGTMVFWVLIYTLNQYSQDVESKPNLQFTHNSDLEIVWTLFPAFILLCIAVPSFSLLYSLDEVIDPTLTVKIIGHQWYWTYEFSDWAFSFGKKSKNLNFEYYMVPVREIKEGELRLLETGNRVRIPSNTHIRLLVTSSDVIHSWAVPSFGIKIDATPGRLTQGSLFVKRCGVFYGQCSEICGINHAFMPISIVALEPEVFKSKMVHELAGASWRQRALQLKDITIA